ncbi:MAG: NADH kinase pos5 [Chrysothrix sp. TS-e1954]|nr:MAG: NADH kinase pos5 [Chrysothrix sp. TS-e1954]
MVAVWISKECHAPKVDEIIQSSSMAACLLQRRSPARKSPDHDLLGLHWPSPPRNIFLLKKTHAPHIDEPFLDYIHHIQSSYPNISLIFEPSLAHDLHSALPFPIYTRTSSPPSASTPDYASKVDLTSTLGGDGTILRASSLFASSPSVPPILSFSMGTLGFLGEWKFSEHKKAFRQVYMSGASASYPNSALGASKEGWSGDAHKGRYMGSGRNARILLRNRLRLSVRDAAENGEAKGRASQTPVHALNEVILHRGRSPHLALLSIHIGSPPRVSTSTTTSARAGDEEPQEPVWHHLTTTLSDGIIISTPTGSTAYSLSSGGAIVHPLVNSLLITPICPRSLSFRPLVLPADAPIRLVFEEANRAERIDVSVDGEMRDVGLGRGGELVVGAEGIVGGRHEGPGSSGGGKEWRGGVPTVVGGRGQSGGDGWVGGLNGLLKFNYPMGEE